jgi:hypothetical protein
VSTGGMNSGYMEIVGDSFKKNAPLLHKRQVVLGIATWGSIENRQLLDKNDGNEIIYKTSRTDKVNRYLNENHSHFILVDNGTEEVGSEQEFRANLESEISETFNIPSVLLVIGGATRSAEHVLHSIGRKTPCVLIESSEKLADILSYGIYQIQHDNKLLIYENTKYVGLDQEFTKQLEFKIDENFKTTKPNNRKKMLKDVIEILNPKYSHLLTVCDVNSEIDVAILQALIAKYDNIEKEDLTPYREQLQHKRDEQTKIVENIHKSEKFQNNLNISKRTINCNSILHRIADEVINEMKKHDQTHKLAGKYTSIQTNPNDVVLEGLEESVKTNENNSKLYERMKDIIKDYIKNPRVQTLQLEQQKQNIKHFNREESQIDVIRMLKKEETACEMSQTNINTSELLNNDTHNDLKIQQEELSKNKDDFLTKIKVNLSLIRRTLHKEAGIVLNQTKIDKIIENIIDKKLLGNEKFHNEFLKSIKKFFDYQKSLLINIEDKLSSSQYYSLLTLNIDNEIESAILEVLIKIRNERFYEKQIKLALTWDRIDITKTFIFTNEKKDKIGSLNNLMFMAIKDNRIEFIQLFLDKGFKFDGFLTPRRLLMLYNDRTESIIGYKLKQKHVNVYTFAHICSCIEDLSENLFEHRFQRDERFSTLSYTYIERAYNNTDDYGNKLDSESYLDINDKMDAPLDDIQFNELFLYTILVEKFEMAKIFLFLGNNQIGSALVATSFIKKFIRMRGDYFEQYLKEFEKIAYQIVDDCYKNNRKNTRVALKHRISDYQNKTPIQLAIETEDLTLPSHPSFQIVLNIIWYYNISMYGNKVHELLLSMATFGFLAPLLITFRKKFEKKNIIVNNLTRLYFFYEAPVVKFAYFQLSYLLFLILFSYVLLCDFYPIEISKNLSGRHGLLIGIPELLLIIWTVTLSLDMIYVRDFNVNNTLQRFKKKTKKNSFVYIASFFKRRRY